MLENKGSHHKGLMWLGDLLIDEVSWSQFSQNASTSPVVVLAQF